MCIVDPYFINNTAHKHTLYFCREDIREWYVQNEAKRMSIESCDSTYGWEKYTDCAEYTFRYNKDWIFSDFIARWFKRISEAREKKGLF